MKKTFLFIATALLTTSLAAQENKQETAVNQYGQEVVSTDGQFKVQDGIMVLDAPSIGYKMWFDLRVQGDAAVFFGGPDFTDAKLDGSENSSHIGNGMSIRRARFAVKTQIDRNWYAELDTDWADGVCELKDAILSYTGVPGLEIKAGNFKENFSLQRNTSSRYLMFMERPMVTALAPSRHLGLGATWSKNWFWASAGVFGPELKGSEEATAKNDNNKDYGRNVGLAYTGKIAIRPLYKNPNTGLHIGGAVSYRNPSAASTDGYKVARYSSRNTTSINRKKYLDTDAINGLDHELLWTAELAGFHRGLRYETAYITRGAFLDKDVNPLGTQWAKGWYAQASYLLFGGRQNYDSDGAKPTRITPGRSWGDVELAFRYELCDFNTTDYFGGCAEAYSFGINFYPMKNIKFVINYQYNNNDRYANGKGKLYVGHDASGKPTKDYTKVVESDGKAGVDYHMISMRFQVAF
ncbi:MAG: porin [Bacteroidia bacterium]|nr:porin [Bacteroidia bacterium]